VLIYFARPDSVLFGQSVAEFRMRLGARLALEAPVPADVVVPVPDSAVYGGLGYAKASGVEFAMAVVRNGFVGRSFIEPTPEARREAVLAKLNPIRTLVENRRVILVDDSIVRGNTCGLIVRSLRAAGAREVHVRVTSPPVIASCHFGVDTPDDRELFAHDRDLPEMARALGVDSLEFLSLAGLHATASSMQGFCDGCFSSSYPVDVTRSAAPDAHRRPNEALINR
jgi:amidophosphoribosyltransferase